MLVAADGSAGSILAIEWAAADAAARGVSLRIVHVCGWTQAFDPGDATRLRQMDASHSAMAVLRAALERAHNVAPEVPTSASLVTGRVERALKREGRGTLMVVLGQSARHMPHDRRSSLPARLARNTATPVAVVSLSAHRSPRAHNPRVILVLEGRGPHTRAVAYAFASAQQRGIALTVLRESRPDGDHHLGEAATKSLRQWSAIYPDVAIGESVMDAPLEAVLSDALVRAALVVIAAPAANGYRRLGRERWEAGRATTLLERTTLAPVVYVPERSMARPTDRLWALATLRQRARNHHRGDPVSAPPGVPRDQGNH